jgi:hypothetical protein
LNSGRLQFVVAVAIPYPLINRQQASPALRQAYAQARDDIFAQTAATHVQMLEQLVTQL